MNKWDQGRQASEPYILGLFPAKLCYNVLIGSKESLSSVIWRTDFWAKPTARYCQTEKDLLRSYFSHLPLENKFSAPHHHPPPVFHVIPLHGLRAIWGQGPACPFLYSAWGRALSGWMNKWMNNWMTSEAVPFNLHYSTPMTWGQFLKSTLWMHLVWQEVIKTNHKHWGNGCQHSFL